MKRNDIREFVDLAMQAQARSTSRYRRRLGIQVTSRCAVGCSHCIFDCAPKTAFDLEIQALAGCIRDWHDLGGSEIGLTGGEPMLRMHLVEEAIAVASGLEMCTAMATSACWANTQARAARRLASLDGLSEIAISIDRYHQEKVPPAHVVNAIRAARDQGVEVRLLVVMSGASIVDDLAPFAEYLFSDVQPEMIRITGLLNQGRARSLEKPSFDGSDAGCGGLDVPLVAATGDVYLCCAFGAVGQQTPLFWRGNITRVSLKKALLETESEYWLAQALRCGGPGFLAKRMVPPTELKFGSNQSMCDQCIKIFSEPKTREMAVGIAQDDSFRREVSALSAARLGDEGPSIRYVLGNKGK